MDDRSAYTGNALRRLSAGDFLRFGVEQIAYIRPATVNGAAVFAIHAADGTPLAFHPDRDAARAMTVQNALCPVTIQ